VHPHVLKLAAQGKPTRAGPLRAMMMSGRVHSTNGSWQPALENELIAFPLATGNGVDDQVDALAHASQEAWPGRHADWPPSDARRRSGRWWLNSSPRALCGGLRMTTASQTDRRTDETEQEFYRRKNVESTKLFMERHGIVRTDDGRIFISEVAFTPPPHRHERL